MAGIKKHVAAAVDRQMVEKYIQAAQRPVKMAPKPPPPKALVDYAAVTQKAADEIAVNLLRAAVDASAGNTEEAAARLGLHPKKLLRELARLGLTGYPAEVRARSR